MSDCTHRWRLEDAGCGPVTAGLCRHCGATRDFPTAFIGDSDPKAGFRGTRVRSKRSRAHTAAMAREGQR